LNEPYKENISKLTFKNQTLCSIYFWSNFFRSFY